MHPISMINIVLDIAGRDSLGVVKYSDRIYITDDFVGNGNALWLRYVNTRNLKHRAKHISQSKSEDLTHAKTPLEEAVVVAHTVVAHNKCWIGFQSATSAECLDGRASQTQDAVICLGQTVLAGCLEFFLVVCCEISKIQTNTHLNLAHATAVMHQEIVTS